MHHTSSPSSEHKGHRLLERGIAAAVVVVFTIVSAVPLGHAAAHYRRGMTAMAGKDDSAAIVEFSAAIHQHPKFARRYYQLGRALLAEGETQEAFAAFSTAVTLDADFVDAQVALRELYLMAAKPGRSGLIAVRHDPFSIGASLLAGPETKAELATNTAGPEEAAVTAASPSKQVQVQGVLGDILTKIDPGHFTGRVSASRFRSIRLENDGTDWGARINTADARLGTDPGVVEIMGGGTFSTTAVISADHVLLIGAGTYTNTSPGPILTPKSNSAILGSGWSTVLMESTAERSWTVIVPFNNHRDNYLGDTNIHIANVQIKGANPHFFSAPPAIGLGNLVYGSVQNVWINATKSIGIQAGGGSAYGNLADAVLITDCLFTHVASQNLAVVNGRNITLQNNVLRDPGQPGGPGSSPIDLEPNMSSDVLDNIRIISNVVDHRGSFGCCGNGIVIYGSASPLTTRPVLVRNNVLIGGEMDPTPTNHMANGIYLINARNVEIAHNTIRRTGQSGIYLAAATQVIVNNNKLFQVGGGGTYGFTVENTTHSRIAGNVIEMRTSGGGSADDHILEVGSSDYNEYVKNVSGGIISVGPHNRLSGNSR